MGKIDLNKQQKRESLLDSAFSLFINNGFSRTSIADIVKEAGVAKGTFYLYFKDKYDIRNHLIAHKGNQVFFSALTALQGHPEITEFEDRIIFIMDHILDQFSANHSLVLLLSKHLSWGIFKNFLYTRPAYAEVSIADVFEEILKAASHTYRTPEIMMYMILELVSGVSYNAIVYDQPLPLEDLKPHIHEIVRNICRTYEDAPKENTNA